MEHLIQNFKELATTPQRENALAIAEAGYDAININHALERKLRIENGDLHVSLPGDGGEKVYRLTGRRVFFVGIGKCAYITAEAVEKLFGDYLTSGVAVDAAAPGHDSLTKIQLAIGTHPLPSEVNEYATKHILKFLSDCKEDDLVIFLISGGGSTLLCAPEAPMTAEDESTIFKELTAHGAAIQDMNIVRKHLSPARGGGLARAAHPAEVLSLIVSDVPGDDVQFICSGPTIQDISTVADAKSVLSRFGITPPPDTVFMETPKEDTYFERVTNTLFLTSHDALTAMGDTAAKLGYSVEVVNTQFSGEAHNVGRLVVEKLRASSEKTVLLYAGESTVTIPPDVNPGKGGRSQEVALSILEKVADDELVMPFASDGHDNTDHAGAISDRTTREHAAALNLSIEEYLSGHKSYDFFKITRDALLTGYTRSNVSDLIVALKG